MILACVALLLAGVFTGAAFYIHIAEQPAWLALEDRALLVEWKLAYCRGFAMQATLALVGSLVGVFAWYTTHRAFFLGGAILLFANWPWTGFVMMGINKQLMATAPEHAEPETRAMLIKRNCLHAVRTVLGLLSALAFLLGLIPN